MAKKVGFVAPPKTGKHESQSLLSGNKDTKFYSQIDEFDRPPKLLGAGAAGANAQAKEVSQESKRKPTGWDINREAKKLAQKAAPKDLESTQASNVPKKDSWMAGMGEKDIGLVSRIREPRGQSHGSQSTQARRRIVPNRSYHFEGEKGLDDPRLRAERRGNDKPEYHKRWRKDQGFKKSDFDDLVNAINLNIINSYSKFRNKKDLDFSAFDKKPEEGKKTKLDKEDIPSKIPKGMKTGRSQGKELGESRGQLRGLKQRKGKPATGQVMADQSILTSRRQGEAKPTKITNQYKNPKTGLMETSTETLNLTPPKKRKRGKVVDDADTKKPEAPKTKNPYRQDEKGKYIRGTGYDKKVTGHRTAEDRKVGSDKDALPLTRYNRRHEGRLQHGRQGTGHVGQTQATGDKVTATGNNQQGGREDDHLGIETTEPLAPHKHLREQDKEGKVIRNRLSTDPKNIKWRKGGKHKEPKEAERAVRQGMQNLKGMDISYKGSRMGIKLKGERHASRGRAGSKTPPVGGEERGKDWWKYWKENTEKSLNALSIKIKENIEGFTPAKETFGDKRWRVPQIKQPKGEKDLAENKRRSDLSRDQWVKDFAMHYQSPKMQQEKEAKEWQKKKMAILKAFLSPISFKYTHKGWGHTYERGQTKNVETQDHSRTGNTNTNQTYKKDKDDLTIKSLDEVFNEWKRKVAKKE